LFEETQLNYKIDKESQGKNRLLLWKTSRANTECQ